MGAAPVPSNAGSAATERTRDVVAAFGAAVYLLAALAFFAWQLFDVWGETYYFLQRVVLQGVLRLAPNDLVAAEKLNSAVFRTLAYATVGGGMGGAVNGARSILQRHADTSNARLFNWRYTYVYIFLPPLGATLGLVAVALMRTGIGVLSGDVGVSQGTGPALSSLAIGFLAGYGSGTVFVWLDTRVSTVFRPSTISVPAVFGQSRTEAEATLLAAKLNLGKVTFEPGASGIPGTVAAQDPRAFTLAAEGSRVDVTLAGPDRAQPQAPAG